MAKINGPIRQNVQSAKRFTKEYFFHLSIFILQVITIYIVLKK